MHGNTNTTVRPVTITKSVKNFLHEVISSLISCLVTLGIEATSPKTDVTGKSDFVYFLEARDSRYTYTTDCPTSPFKFKH